MSVLKQILENFNQNTFKAKEVLEYFEKKYTNLTTRMSKLSAFKKEILLLTKVPGYSSGYAYTLVMRKENEDPILIPREILKLKLTKRNANKVHNHRKKQLENKLKEFAIIKKSKKFRRDILKGLKGETYDELLPAILIASGRRINELYKISTDFKRVSDDRKMTLFSGQSKTIYHNSYEIPLLVRYSTFKKAWNKFRDLPEVRDNLSNDTKEIHNAYHKQAERVFRGINKRFFENYHNSTPHFFRSVWLAFAYDDSDKSIPLPIFAKEYLGHFSVVSQIHYTNIKLV